MLLTYLLWGITEISIAEDQFQKERSPQEHLQEASQLHQALKIDPDYSSVYI